MRKVIKGAVVGGVLGIAAPVALAVANEFVWSRSTGETVEPRICFADRLWNLQRVQIVHAPGCKNKILDSVPFCLLLGILGGSAIGALSLAIKRNTTSPSNSSSSLTSATPASPAATTESVKESSSTTPTTSKQERVSATPPPRVRVPGEGLKGFDWRTVGKLGAVAVVVAGVGFGGLSLVNRTNTTDASNALAPFAEPTVTASPDNTFENSCRGLEEYFNTRSGEFAHHTIASGFKNSAFQDGVANAKAAQAFLENELGKGPNTHLFGGDGIPLYFCKGGTISVYGPSFLKVCDAATIQWKQGEGLKWSAPKCETMPPQPIPE